MKLPQTLLGVASGQAEKVRQQVRAAARSALLIGIAAVLLLCGVLVLLLGFYQSLALYMPHWQAGGLVALGILLVCFVLLALANLTGRRGAPGTRPNRAAGAQRMGLSDDPAAELGSAAGAAAEEALRNLKPSAVDMTVAAFVAGLLASRASRSEKRDRST